MIKQEAKYYEAFTITEEMEISIVASIKSNQQQIQAVTCERVRTATKEDPYMRILSNTIINGFPNEASCLPPQLQPYWQHKGNLSIVDEVIMFKDRIIVPPSLRPEICITLHSAHQGTSAMSERARKTVFWPGISSSIQNTREKCNTCWEIAPSQSHFPPVEPTISTSPFEAIASDYLKLHGHSYLVIVDRFSNWPHITKVEHGPTTIGAKRLIRALKRTFATFGVPFEISSDGRPEFTAEETKGFLRRWGVHHRLSSAYNPRSNNRAEVAVKAMKRLLWDNIASNGSIDTEGYTRQYYSFEIPQTPPRKRHPQKSSSVVYFEAFFPFDRRCRYVTTTPLNRNGGGYGSTERHIEV